MTLGWQSVGDHSGDAFRPELPSAFARADATAPSTRLTTYEQLYNEPREPIFEKCSHLREKGGVLIPPPPQICMVGCMGRISHTNLKKLYGDF
jgi:hypothetical protein